MIKGSIVALVTPFNEDGSVNFEALTNLLEFQISNGTDGILVLGTTGESSTMTHEEDDSVVEHTMKVVNGRVPVIAGSGSNDTQTAIEKSLKYERMGVDALLLITPYYNKANEEGMIRHFLAVADRVHTPIIIYNVPGRTGCSLSLHAVEVLSKHKNIVGIKEASGNISYAANVAKLLNDDFVMYSGNDDMVVPILSLGGSGVISVFANTNPKECHEMVTSYLNGDTKKALDIQLKYLDYIHSLFYEVNPIPVKAALNLMGMHAGTLRLPLYEMSEANKAKMKAEMEKVGLL
ncbi:MAG: 4-hydroxy-tetrahydrodipicolinate synthase [Erysipelotrichaceae bacterium]|nr:4-hydroxy-tetrahydrodipicolinate synthase [Erysipelotrichaceae bacterium]